MKHLKNQVFLFAILFSTLSAPLVYAQDADEESAEEMKNEMKKESPLDFSLSLRTGYLWRGFVLTDNPMAAVYLNYKLSKKGDFSLGFWGALPFSGYENDDYYRDVNLYVQYAANGFSVGIWDLFNTADVGNVPIEDFNVNFFNFGDKTNHLLDFRSSYTFPSKVYLEFDVMFFGAKEKDANDKQKYSSYVQFGLPLIKNRKVNLDWFIGAGFTLGGTDSHLYGNGENKFDITNIGFSASKAIKLLGMDIPVNANIKWNPSSELVRIEFVTTLF